MRFLNSYLLASSAESNFFLRKKPLISMSFDVRQLENRYIPLEGRRLWKKSLRIF
jgi:hypothetical protein